MSLWHDDATVAASAQTSAYVFSIAAYDSPPLGASRYEICETCSVGLLKKRSASLE
ncbi:hypothetical protein EDD27_3735 [Nonomuraea polychroma]|uniref:Uncharacterized protein n=1 Tax=Nonomuraea polychroma TaxID=46176 RepID=A0A438M626_9ACTN|nr:hypothetical protein EDD27_3735 [Nonomuraea polychroma]